jgi:hypothetical protein
MSPAAVYGSFVLILAVSAVVGWAVLLVTGRRGWSWLAPALGLAVLVVLCGATVYLPGRGTTATIALVAAIVASLAFTRSRAPDLRLVARLGLPVVLVVVLAGSVPFAAGGGFEVLGSYVNNDLAFHIYNAEWLRAHEGIEPQQIADGYPTGPHGLVVAVAGLTPIAIPATWMGLLIATAAVTALASLTVLERLHPVLRTVGALLVGLSYLGASFYVQSAFKETMMALFALGFALALREAAREGSDSATKTATQDRVKAGVPPAAFAAAAFATYSGPGIALVAGTLGVWIAVTLLLGTTRAAILDAVRSRRWLLPVALAGVALAALVGVFVWDQAADYIGGRDVIGQDALVNLFEPLPPSEALGIWLSSDYRVTVSAVLPIGALLRDLLVALALLAAGLGVWRLARRRELALLSALVAAVAAYLVGRYSLGPYVGSKALAVMAPLVMLVALVGVAPGAEDRDDYARWARAALMVVFVTLALCSSYVALAGARLDNDDHDAELAELRSQMDGQRVLFLGSDEYVPWYLRGASVKSPFGTSPGLYAEIKPTHPLFSERADFDTLFPEVLDQFDYAITTKSSYASAPPPNFRPVDSTDSFILWERTGPTPERMTLPEGELPGEVLDCEADEGRAISRQSGRAYVFPTPPILVPFGKPYGDEPSEGAEVRVIREGEPFTRSVRLPRGRWKISLQYFSPEPLVVDAPGLLHRVMPPNSTRIGPYWPVGTIEVDDRQRVSFTIEPEERPSVRRLLTGPDAVRTGPQSVLGALAATRAGEEREQVPLSEACGRFVDWYEVSVSS